MPSLPKFRVDFDPRLLMERTQDGRAAALAPMKTEQRLALLDFILDSTSDVAIVATDRHGMIAAWNEGARRIYGYEASQALGHPVSLVLSDSRDGGADRALRLLDTVHTTGRWSGEIKRYASDGHPMLTQVTIVMRRGANGEDVGFMVLARDLTLEKQVQNAMREQAAYTRNLFESNIDALVTTDTEGIITDLNRQMCNLTGFSREELIGTRFSDYSDAPERAREGIKRVLADERLTDYELTIRHRSGQQTAVAYNAAVMRGADARPRGVFAAARDITATKALEDQLRRKNDLLREQNRRVEEANRLKTEFLANMSHELRTPLNAMIGFAEIIYDHKAGPLTADQQEYLGDILTSARHLLQLINDVLDLAKIESGKMEFQPEPTNLMAIVAEVRDILRSIAAAKRVTIVTEIDRSIGTLVLDPGKMKQVFYNFLSNALKFTPDGGRVTIRANRHGEKDFMVEIEDSGIGISDEDIKRLFVEFQQLDASIAKKYQGTGLGLALTKRIVEAQGGEVGVRSNPGVGSAFWARLPLHDSVDRSVRGLASEVTAGDRPKVLVIEDDPSDRAALIRIISGGGYAPVIAINGAEARAHLARTRFVAITLDILLNDVAAAELMTSIRQSGLNADTPAIAVSIIDGQPTTSIPVQEWLAKPVNGDRLLRSLSRLAARTPEGLVHGEGRNSDRR